ncbi:MULTISPECIES: hypothetical protein [unclassified Nocardioides]|uniref:hypothetical protein n=1 Tax=unclassified Nocardioides TaxID=2615069 RepID=UPI0006F696DD|nr:MULTISPECIES: hypothetical protein [unclassified Nocardioides]KQY62433.1 hypothetical protein ASD30_23990 [Nocardioides sp. Root140]KRF16885.1 hypothetical protein ASH02_02155 [Nocardioides sp. Soil796]
MDTHAVDPSRTMLTFGRVDLVRVQVGYRASPETPAYQQFLLDLPVLETVDGRDGEAFDERLALSALEPVVFAGGDAPRHYSLHQHRSHTSWGPSSGAVEIGLLVTTGSGTRASGPDAPLDGVTRAFRDLMEVVGRPESAQTSRDAAILRARAAAATAYAVDADTLSLSAEEHHQTENSWTFKLRSRAGDTYAVVVGFVDGYAGSVRVRHEKRFEVSDSIGSE